MSKSKTFRPEELASELGVSGKQIRGFLRATFTRPVTAKGSTWVLTAAQAKKTREHFLSRRATSQKPAAKRNVTRKASAVTVKRTKPTAKPGTRASATAPLPNPADTGKHANP